LRSSSAWDLGSVTLHRRHIKRRRQEVNNRIEQRLHALVLEGGAIEDRNQISGECSRTNRGLELLFGDFLILENLHHEILVVVGGDLEQLGTVELGVIRQLGRNLNFVPAGTQVFAVPNQSLHLDQVDDTLIIGLGTDGKLQDSHSLGEPFLDGVEHEVEISSGAIHLVDETHSRDRIAVGLTPHRLGLRFNTGDTVEHGYRAVKYTKGTLYLDGEVDVAGRVDDVDPMIVPDAVGCG